MPLQLRRTTKDFISTTTFLAGEPVVAIDTGELYIGDGTPGGFLVGGNGGSFTGTNQDLFTSSTVIFKKLGLGNPPLVLVESTVTGALIATNYGVAQRPGVNVRSYRSNYPTNESAFAPALLMEQSRGTGSSPTAVLVNDTLGALNFGGYDGATWSVDNQLAPVGFVSYALENWAGNATTSTNAGSGFFIRAQPNGVRLDSLSRQRLIGTNWNNPTTTSPPQAVVAIGHAQLGVNTQLNNSAGTRTWTGFGATQLQYINASSTHINVNNAYATFDGSISGNVLTIESMNQYQPLISPGMGLVDQSGTVEPQQLRTALYITGFSSGTGREGTYILNRSDATAPSGTTFTASPGENARMGSINITRSSNRGSGVSGRRQPIKTGDVITSDFYYGQHATNGTTVGRAVASQTVDYIGTSTTNVESAGSITFGTGYFNPDSNYTPGYSNRLVLRQDEQVYRSGIHSFSGTAPYVDQSTYAWEDWNSTATITTAGPTSPTGYNYWTDEYNKSLPPNEQLVNGPAGDLILNTNQGTGPGGEIRLETGAGKGIVFTANDKSTVAVFNTGTANFSVPITINTSGVKLSVFHIDDNQDNLIIQATRGIALDPGVGVVTINAGGGYPSTLEVDRITNNDTGFITMADPVTFQSTITGTTATLGNLFLNAISTSTSSYALLYNTTTNQVGYGVPSVVNAQNIIGNGAGNGALLYQESPNTTKFLGQGSSGWLLASQGSGSPPAFTSPAIITVNRSNNLSGAVEWGIPYQRSVVGTDPVLYETQYITTSTSTGTYLSWNGSGYEWTTPAGGNPFDQSLNTTSDVEFNSLKFAAGSGILSPNGASTVLMTDGLSTNLYSPDGDASILLTNGSGSNGFFDFTAGNVSGRFANNIINFYMNGADILVAGSGGTTLYTENGNNSLTVASAYARLGNDSSDNGYFEISSAGAEVNGKGNSLKVNATGVRINDNFYLPTSDGTADQVIKTNGSGVLSWTDPPIPDIISPFLLGCL